MRKIFALTLLLAIVASGAIALDNYWGFGVGGAFSTMHADYHHVDPIPEASLLA